MPCSQVNDIGELSTLRTTIAGPQGQLSRSIIIQETGTRISCFADTSTWHCHAGTRNGWSCTLLVNDRGPFWPRVHFHLFTTKAAADADLQPHYERYRLSQRFLRPIKCGPISSQWQLLVSCSWSTTPIDPFKCPDSIRPHIANDCYYMQNTRLLITYITSVVLIQCPASLSVCLFRANRGEGRPALTFFSSAATTTTSTVICSPLPLHISPLKLGGHA